VIRTVDKEVERRVAMSLCNQVIGICPVHAEFKVKYNLQCLLESHEISGAEWRSVIKGSVGYYVVRG
jgi:hypothetical protein